ncbi:hypothetical protein SHKM778_27510 [Streptomyces sp. KM77-8]|uniref:Secreted protein n=1 Tax=Streptomyces haneummycinicus TaxID=3074435 RepID=A0AAT9HGA5_9ACTN
MSTGLFARASAATTAPALCSPAAARTGEKDSFPVALVVSRTVWVSFSPVAVAVLSTVSGVAVSAAGLCPVRAVSGTVRTG